MLRNSYRWQCRERRERSWTRNQHQKNYSLHGKQKVTTKMDSQQRSYGLRMSAKSTNVTRPLRICTDDAEPRTDKAASQTPDNEVEVNQQGTEVTPELGDDEII